MAGRNGITCEEASIGDLLNGGSCNNQQVKGDLSESVVVVTQESRIIIADEIVTNGKPRVNGKGICSVNGNHCSSEGGSDRSESPSESETSTMSACSANSEMKNVVSSNGVDVVEEPRVEAAKGISKKSIETSSNGDSARADSPSSSTSSSLSASSSNNTSGELVINGDLGETNNNHKDSKGDNNNNNNTSPVCAESPCASEMKAGHEEGPHMGQMNGHSDEDPVIIFQFELAQHLCGRLIGRHGHFVNRIKEKCKATVIVNRHPLSPNYKICSIEGTRSQIRRALRLIRNRFPIYEFPEVTLQQINVISPLLQACQVTVPQSCQLHLPEGVSCDVILSNVVNAGHIFVRQPTHPTYPSLSRLDQFMNATYSVETPPVLAPNPGDICAVNICNGWYRAMVVNSFDEEVEVKFVDYGGYTRAPISSLRQIRYDFMTLPFQATECYLANVKPTDENQGWSKEANVVFHDLAQGQMLQAKIVAYADDGIPLIHLHKIQGASNIFINQELVNRGLAQWVEHQMWE